MTEHDQAVLERVRAERGSLVVEADEPDVVADAIVAAGGRRVPAAELGTWLQEATLLRERADAVLAAEEVVAGAVAADRSARAALLGEPAADASSPAVVQGGGQPTPDPAPGHDDDPHAARDADRQAVRFSLAILVPAQLAGLAVYRADGTELAVVAPALALVGVLITAVTHRESRARGRSGPPALSHGGGTVGQGGGGESRDAGKGSTEPSATSLPAVPRPPAVHAAEAHLRRQQAAWKLAWWERGLRPLDVATWVGSPGDDRGATSTLVVVDGADDVDADVVARMTAAVPAAVRVVLVRALPA